LFEVFMVYGEDRDNPEVQPEFVVADDAKQAELKSGLVADLPACSHFGVSRSGLGFRLCHDV